MKLLGWLLVSAVGIHAGVSLLKITTSSAPDFSVYYHSAQNLLTGGKVYGAQLFTGLGYPPHTLLMYIPLTLLPYQLAQGLWVVGSFFLIPLCIYLTLRLLKENSTVLGVFIFSSVAFLLFPTKFTLGMGQSNLVVLFLVLASVTVAKNEGLSGLLLGMAWILKPHLILVGLAFVFAKQWRVLLVALLTVVGAIIMTGVLFGWQVFGVYITHELPQLLAYSGREIYYNQGIGAFLARLLPVMTASRATALAMFVLFVWTLVFLKTHKQSLVAHVAILLTLLLLIEPLSWQHHYVFLIPAFLLLWIRIKTSALWALFLAVILVGANIKHPEALMNLPMAPLILSHVFLGTILVFMLLVAVEYKKRMRQP